MSKPKRNGIYSFFVRCWFTAKMALNGILSNAFRSALTILGVAIGVASVVSLMGIGEGARQNVIQQFESLGTNVISIKANLVDLEFKPEVAEELVERVNGLEMTTPVVQTYTTMKWRRDRSEVDIVGVNSSFPAIRDNKLVSGEFFSKLHVDQRSYVAVLGYNVAVGLTGGRSPVGQTIALDGQSYRILGVLESKGKGKADDIDDKVVIPYTTAQRIAKKRTVEEIWGKASSAEDAELVTIQLGRIFKKELNSTGSNTAPPTEEDNMAGEVMMGAGGMISTSGESSSNENNNKTESSRKVEGMTITSLNQMIDEIGRAHV